MRFEKPLNPYELFMYCRSRTYDQVNGAVESLREKCSRPLDLDYYQAMQHRINKIAGLVEPHL